MFCVQECISKPFSSFTGALVTRDDKVRDQVLSFWPPSYARWQVYDIGARAMQDILHEVPDIMVSSMDLQDISGDALIRLVKSENVYRKMPTLLCLDLDEFSPNIDLGGIALDDFIILPTAAEEFKTRLELAILRSYRNMDANPLTHLPGNTSIIRYFQDHLERKNDFALCYCDLDYFKSFNDSYGFSRGDEVLMMAARIIVNTVKQIAAEDSFVGHVGGDDFIFTVPPELAEEACQKVLASFDDIVPHFYDHGDRTRGCITCKDRQGVMRTFPLMTISIAVVFNINGSLTHYSQASQQVMGLKKKAKEEIKSAYVLDKRHLYA